MNIHKLIRNIIKTEENEYPVDIHNIGHILHVTIGSYYTEANEHIKAYWLVKYGRQGYNYGIIVYFFKNLPIIVSDHFTSVSQHYYVNHVAAEQAANYLRSLMKKDDVMITDFKYFDEAGVRIYEGMLANGSKKLLIPENDGWFEIEGIIKDGVFQSMAGEYKITDCKLPYNVVYMPDPEIMKAAIPYISEFYEWSDYRDRVRCYDKLYENNTYYDLEWDADHPYDICNQRLLKSTIADFLKPTIQANTRAECISLWNHRENGIDWLPADEMICQTKVAQRALDVLKRGKLPYEMTLADGTKVLRIGNYDNYF